MRQFVDQPVNATQMTAVYDAHEVTFQNAAVTGEYDVASAVEEQRLHAADREAEAAVHVL